MEKAPEFFDSKSVKELVNVIEKRLAGLPPGIAVQYAGGTYDPKVLKVRFEFTLTECKKKSITEQRYDRYRVSRNLPEWGFIFKFHDGDEYQMVDYKPKSPKYPLICKNLRTGTEYKFSVGQVQVYLKQ